MVEKGKPDWKLEGAEGTRHQRRGIPGTVKTGGRQPTAMAGPVANWTCLLRSIDRRNVPYRHLGDHAGDLGEQGIGNRFLPVAGICDATGEAHRSDCGNDHGPHGFSANHINGRKTLHNS